ncbi:hypothetical protein ACSRUE_19290 [Sorangium sp. KYC3313]|uniref:hypothetical protein n=1 Tax=Sorangium sp. KYC3313 TaxID=3449740 RepID=UPI003F8C9E5C
MTFIDVLGWKGIWLRRTGPEVVRHLKKLVDTAEMMVRGADETKVLSISDTIVLLTIGEPKIGLQLHGDVTAQMICDSISYGLPLRGATACGQFFVEPPSILVGPAVDEAASWHEATDWIGVIQTPSAFLAYDGIGPWREEHAPVKGGGVRPFKIPCVDWPRVWRKQGRTRQELQRYFSAMGPFDTSVATKYTNTLLFYGDDLQTLVPSGA